MAVKIRYYPEVLYKGHRTMSPLRPLLIIVSLLGLAVLSPLRASVDITSLYRVLVPVADTSISARNDAFVTALKQVLSRLSRAQHLPDRPGYTDVLNNAASMVKGYQLIDDKLAGLQLQVTFDRGSVQHAIHLLRIRHAAPPPVLLWVFDAGGKLLGREALAGLALVAQQHGYRVIYPDAQALLPEPGGLTLTDPAMLAALTRHYHTGLVLLGHLQDGGASWTLLSGGRTWQWTDKTGEADTLLIDAGRVMADQLGQPFRVIGVKALKTRLWVSGLNSAWDYVRLMELLHHASAVLRFTTLEAKNRSVLLEVTSNLPRSAWMSEITAQGHLLPVVNPVPESEADLRLRWLY